MHAQLFLQANHSSVRTNFICDFVWVRLGLGTAEISIKQVASQDENAFKSFTQKKGRKKSNISAACAGNTAKACRVKV